MKDRNPAGGEPMLAALAQQRLWFLAELDPQSPAYNEAIMVTSDEPLDTHALRRALSEIVRRHEALRTVFFTRDGQVFQKIVPPAEVALPIVDLRAQPESERVAQALQLAVPEARRPFDLATGPLLRAQLMRLGDRDERLFITVHHIVIDGLSYFQAFIPELHTLYNAFRNGRPSPLSDLPMQYADFADWQRGWLSHERLAPQLGYWKAQLAGMQDLDLPADFARSEHPAKNGARHPIALSAKLSESLKNLSRRYDVSLFTVVLAAWKTLLFRYTGQIDVVVGTAVAGRRRPELAPLIGFFTNTLVLRTQLDGNLTFGQLLGRVRDVLESARAHQDVPFERLLAELNVPRMLNRNPLFSTTCIVMPPTTAPGTAPHFTVTRFDIGIAKLDLYLELHQRLSGLSGHLEYRTDLFREATIARLAGHLRTLLADIAENPEKPLNQLALLTDAEKAELVMFQGDAADRPRPPIPPPLPQLFEAQVEQTPDAVALVLGADALSYRELNVRVNRLAHYLRALGIGPDVLVGLCLEPSFEIMIAILAIHKAGGAYLPLDPAYPAERLRFMIEDARPRILITVSALLSVLPPHESRTVCLDVEEADIVAQPTENPSPLAAAHHLCYVMYTSGSTGRPKGVLIEHGSLSNLIHSDAERFGIGSHSRILMFSSFSFDPSAFDFTMALSCGATLVLASRLELLPGSELARLLHEQAISFLVLPPSALAVLPNETYPALKTILVGAETCTSDLVARFSPGRRFCNGYGPTEITFMSTVTDCSDPLELPPIGRPLPNVEVYILDGARQQVPVGVAGELYIGGAGLARGYLNQPELTAERFIANPIRGASSPRIYRSGDRVRWRRDGNIEFLGRIDRQVKLRGYRIELGEIEATLSRHPALREAAVRLHEDQPGDKRLVAYVVPRPGAAISDTELPLSLSTFLKEKLPDYMVPTGYTVMEALPLSPTGKLERSALPAPAVTLASRPSYEAPNSEIEQAIIAVWQEVLRLDRIGVRDNFFDLGGHSLLLAQVQGKLSIALHRDIRMMDLFRYPTVRELALHLSSTTVSEPLDPENSEPNDASDPLTKDSRDRARRQRSAHRSTRARRRSPQ